jgi:hypothetical protein
MPKKKLTRENKYFTLELLPEAQYKTVRTVKDRKV